MMRFSFLFIESLDERVAQGLGGNLDVVLRLVMRGVAVLRVEAELAGYLRRLREA